MLISVITVTVVAGGPASFVPQPGRYLTPIDEMQSIAPALDFVVRDMPQSDERALYVLVVVSMVCD